MQVKLFWNYLNPARPSISMVRRFDPFKAVNVNRFDGGTGLSWNTTLQVLRVKFWDQ